ncbi:MAG: SET domain-containing protein-lysine N-methyltransferase [Blastocatellia bacterium]
MAYKLLQGKKAPRVVRKRMFDQSNRFFFSRNYPVRNQEKTSTDKRRFVSNPDMNTNLNSNTVFRILSEEGFATVRERQHDGHKGLFSQQTFRAGNVLCVFSAQEVRTTPNRLTLQTGQQQHILLSPNFLQYVNHSCAPNVLFDTTSQQVRCLQDIQVGDELTFFYPSTEWEMDEPFACQCGARDCLREIRGAAFMPQETLHPYQLTDFIQEQLRSRTP